MKGLTGVATTKEVSMSESYDHQATALEDIDPIHTKPASIISVLHLEHIAHTNQLRANVTDCALSWKLDDCDSNDQ